ncbi:hypothetical protein FGB62_107g118 [Gracilaria domingensis]|nr:hypothetical protein FGB62_107g118 [Gracilaria domingensis]
MDRNCVYVHSVQQTLDVAERFGAIPAEPSAHGAKRALLGSSVRAHEPCRAPADVRAHDLFDARKRGHGQALLAVAHCMQQVGKEPRAAQAAAANDDARRAGAAQHVEAIGGREHVAVAKHGKWQHAARAAQCGASAGAPRRARTRARRCARAR